MNNKTKKEPPSNEVKIANEASLEAKIENMAEAGVDRLAVMADFDRTLTTAYVDGERRPSIISILRDGDYISFDYAKRAHELYDKYHPIEIDPEVGEEERVEAMNNWWREHFDLLIESGLKIDHIHQAVEAGKIKFRLGAKDFFKGLADQGVPLVIVSSSGLGVESIQFVLEEEGFYSGNIKIVSNQFVWDKDGRAVGVEEPLVHIANKDQVVAGEAGLEGRDNIILLGDSIDDLKMVEGVSYSNLVSVGFLNEEVEKNIGRYLDSFDVVVRDDGSMALVNKIISRIKG